MSTSIASKKPPHAFDVTSNATSAQPVGIDDVGHRAILATSTGRNELSPGRLLFSPPPGGSPPSGSPPSGSHTIARRLPSQGEARRFGLRSGSSFAEAMARPERVVRGSHPSAEEPLCATPRLRAALEGLPPLRGMAPSAEAAPTPAADAASPPERDVVSEGLGLVGVAQRNMRHGRPWITGTTRIQNSFGTSRYPQLEASYQPRSRMLIVGTTFSDLLTNQGHLIDENLERYRAEYTSPEGASVDPIEAQVTADGRLAILDGHHRFAQGVAMGRPVPLLIHLDSEPSEARDWRGVSIRHAR